MLDGQVEVDGEIVTRLGTKVDPTHRRDPGGGQAAAAGLAERLPGRSTSRAASSPPCRTREGRRTLSDLVADRPERLFHVGRLDTDTSGLLLLTNDGDFAQRMAHPSYEVDKTYVAEVDGEVTRATIKALLEGVTLEDGPVTVSQARIVSRSGRGDGARSIVELVIHEGRNRIVRRLLDQLGHPVRRLTRTAIGPVQLAGPRRRRAPRAHPRRARRPAGQRPALSRLAGGADREAHRVHAALHQPTQRARGAGLVVCSLALGLLRWSEARRRCGGASSPGSDPARGGLARPHARAGRRDGDRRDGRPTASRSTTSSRSSSPRPPTWSRSSRRTPRGGSASATSRCSAPGSWRSTASMPRVVRMMAHVETDLPRADITHVYLHGAAALRTRPDPGPRRSPTMSDGPSAARCWSSAPGCSAPRSGWRCAGTASRCCCSDVNAGARPHRLRARCRRAAPARRTARAGGRRGAARPRSAPRSPRALTAYPDAVVTDVGSVKSEPLAQLRADRRRRPRAVRRRRTRWRARERSGPLAGVSRRSSTAGPGR